MMKSLLENSSYRYVSFYCWNDQNTWDNENATCAALFVIFFLCPIKSSGWMWIVQLYEARCFICWFLVFWRMGRAGNRNSGIPVSAGMVAAKRSARCPEADHVPEATTPALLSCARGVSRWAGFGWPSALYTKSCNTHSHTQTSRTHTHTSKYTVFHATNMVFLYNYLTHCSYHTTAFTLPFEDSFRDRHSFRPSKMPKKSQLSQHSSGRPRHRRKPLMWTTEGFISSSHNIFMYSYMHSYVKKCIYIYTYIYIFYDILRFVFMIYFLGVGLEVLRSFSLMADGKSHRHT